MKKYLYAYITMLMPRALIEMCAMRLLQEYNNEASADNLNTPFIDILKKWRKNG